MMTEIDQARAIAIALVMIVFGGALPSAKSR
jgi:hypothetical protein